MMFRLKKAIIIMLLASIILFGAVRILHYQEHYSPLQMLYSTDSEAQRLLKFLTSYHYQCNNTLNSSKTFVWPICIDQDVGFNYDPSVPKLAYSIGPLPDYNFEALLSQNLSMHQLVFLPKSATVTPQLLQLNASVFRTTVVPNDPADFSRNSYDMNTINSIMSKLGHRYVDIFKLEHVQDVMHSYEILYFMAKDGILIRFQQLHIVIEIDKVDESYLYNWYKTLYILFHSAGFRLYHTSASSPLCLQVTMMESCRYFLSWVQDPGPHTLVLYPPALDGSEKSEVQRLKEFLDVPPKPNEDVISVVLSSSIMLRLSRHTIMSGADNCRILVFRFQKGSAVMEEVSALHMTCSIIIVTPVVRKRDTYSLSLFSVRGPGAVRKTLTLPETITTFLPASNQLTSVVYIDLGSSGWSVLSALLDSGAMKSVNQLIIVAPVFPVHNRGFKSAHELRQHYSELKRITAFNMTLSEATSQLESTLHFQEEGDTWQMNFVKS